MNQLFPIIRRKRRPLLPEESVPDAPLNPPPAAGNVEPPKTQMQVDGTDATTATDNGKQAGDENVPTSSESR